MKLNDDVYILSLPMNFGGQVNSINLSLILDATNGPTLVDTGLPGQTDLLQTALAEAHLTLQDLKRIIITHQDIDHVGSLHDLVQSTGVPVLAHAAEIPYIDGTLPLVKFPTPAMMEKMPALRVFERLQPTPVDQPLQDNTRLDLAGGVRVIATPGHAPGHISLYLERSQTLITGDALTAADGRLSGPNPQATPDLPTAWQSVQKLAALDIQTIICYHGGVVSHAAGEQLRRLAPESATRPAPA